MCSPTLVITAVSAGLGFIQSQQQASYTEAVARNNQIMADRATADAIKRGKDEETRRRLQTLQDVGTERSKLASGGFDVNSGSALTKQSDIRAMGDVEAVTIRNNAQREAYGIQTQNYATQAEAKGNAAASRNAGFTSLISGATSVYSGYSKLSKSGAINKPFFSRG